MLLEEKKLFFLLAEMVLGVSLFFSYKLYKAFINPILLMKQGTDALKEEDFNITFTKTGIVEMDHLVEVFNKMIIRIRQERVSLKEQHFFLEKVIEASPNGIIVFDFDDKLTMANPFAQKLFGIEESSSSSNLSSFDHPIAKALLDLESGANTVVKLNGWQQYKCYMSHILHQGFKRKFVIIEDLSSEILSSEKKAYGKIIRMMAHEVNNSIGAINSILQTVNEIHLDLEFEEKAEVTSALNVAINRNGMLNQFMKNFAEVVRLPKAVMEDVDLVELTKRMTVLFSAQLEEKQIEIECVHNTSKLVVKADEGQLEQVLVNIIKNSMESIETNGKIQLHVESNGILRIRDNGAGISPEVLDKLFQPFYSTKSQGQGVGLTLIKEILHQHKASFKLTTLSSGWTEFFIQFS